MSVNMAYALIAHLLLHLHQIMLVKHRDRRSPPQYTLPFNVSPFDWSVGFKLSFSKR